MKSVVPVHGLLFDHHLGVHLKQEFIPADVSHHDHGRGILETPGRSHLPIYLCVLRVLDKDRGCSHIAQGGPCLSEEHLDLVKGAVDLGLDIPVMKGPSVFVDGRSARHLDQGSLGFAHQSSPGKGGPITYGLWLAGVGQLPDMSL